MAIDTPTDRTKSVGNRCVIEVFDGVFVLSHCFLDWSVGVGDFVIGLSQISSFFLLISHYHTTFRCACCFQHKISYHRGNDGLPKTNARTVKMTYISACITLLQIAKLLRLKNVKLFSIYIPGTLVSGGYKRLQKAHAA